MIQIKIDDSNGRGHETTLYNLNVLNQLAMACIDNEKLNDKKVASDLGTDGAESEESEEVWTTARDWCFNHQLPIYAIEPKRAVSELLTDICESRPDREQWYRNASGTLIFPKWACNILDKVYENNTFLLEYRTE